MSGTMAATPVNCAQVCCAVCAGQREPLPPEHCAMSGARRLHTALTRSLSIQHPIISAPMAGVALGRLAGAVAQGGGLGLIGLGSSAVLTPEEIRREWAVASATAGPECPGRLGFGLLANHVGVRDAAFVACLELQPHAVWVTAGDPAAYLGALRAAGVRAIVQAFTMAEAVRAQECGADVIVVQGCDAGGHGRQRAGASVVSLIPTARQHLGAAAPPLVAAGGIMDGRGVAAALMLGADGVAMGTRFLPTAECAAPAAYKQRVVDLRDGTSGTVATSTWDLLLGSPFAEGGFAGRGIADSRALERFGRRDEGDAAGITAADREWYRGAGVEARAVWCGTGGGLVGAQAEARAADVVRGVVRDAVECIAAPAHFAVA